MFGWCRERYLRRQAMETEERMRRIAERRMLDQPWVMTEEDERIAEAAKKSAMDQFYASR